MQIIPITDINLFEDDLVSAQKHKINTPQLKNYQFRVIDSHISPNGNFIAITQQMYSILKEKEGYPIVQLYNIINGEELYSKQWEIENSLISIQFSFDSSLFVMLDTENLNIMNVQEINKIQIIKLKSERIISIDTDNNIILLLSNNNIFVYSTKNQFQYTLNFESENEIEYLHMIGLNNAIYTCGHFQYLLNVQNKKVLRRWINHEYDITNQINYKNLLVIQSSGYNIKLVYIRLQQSGKMIRKYFNSNIRQGQNRITQENQSISIFSFAYCRIKQPILNANVFKIEMNVNKFDLLQGGFKKYNFKIDQDYDLRKEFPIYLLNDNQLKYYLFI